jgi:hypothetical protein
MPAKRRAKAAENIAAAAAAAAGDGGAGKHAQLDPNTKTQQAIDRINATKGQPQTFETVARLHHELSELSKDDRKAKATNPFSKTETTLADIMRDFTRRMSVLRPAPPPPPPVVFKTNKTIDEKVARKILEEARIKRKKLQRELARQLNDDENETLLTDEEKESRKLERESRKYNRENEKLEKQVKFNKENVKSLGGIEAPQNNGLLQVKFANLNAPFNIRDGSSKFTHYQIKQQDIKNANNPLVVTHEAQRKRILDESLPAENPYQPPKPALLSRCELQLRVLRNLDMSKLTDVLETKNAALLPVGVAYSRPLQPINDWSHDVNILTPAENSALARQVQFPKARPRTGQRRPMGR